MGDLRLECLLGLLNWLGTSVMVGSMSGSSNMKIVSCKILTP
jgi:hypothetical protein